jgi:hypothetical protein
MLISNFTLAAGQVLAIQTDSILGIEIQSQGFLFATVYDVYSGSDLTASGDSIMFKEKDAIKMKYGSTIFYILNESDIRSKETPLS